MAARFIVARPTTDALTRDLGIIVEEMQPTMMKDGFAIHRNVLNAGQVTELRDEADSIAKSSGTACVRHIRQRSPRFHALAVSDMLVALLPHGMRPVRSILFEQNSIGELAGIVASGSDNRRVRKNGRRGVWTLVRERWFTACAAAGFLASKHGHHSFAS